MQTNNHASPHLSKERNIFFQQTGVWTKKVDLEAEVWTQTGNVTHPIRPNHKPEEMLYKRYVPEVETTISFRVVNPIKDSDIFHRWHHQPRVAEFWELNLSKLDLQKYLQDKVEDAHTTPAIVEFDGKPVGYFEFYWVKEDRLGPYYESDDYDQGFHFLIGEREALGRHKTHAVLKCNLHYLFLSDPRTRKVMAEPRHDNEKVLKYVETFPVWRKVKEFDFPHKRAVLIECTRETFFTGNHL